MQHEHHRVPVTALAHWNEKYVLAGVGPRLQIYDLEERVLRLQVPIFSSQAIHGILVSPIHGGQSIALVWGSRQLCAVRLSKTSGVGITLDKGIPVETEDWILDGAFSEDHGEDCISIALITAHNALAVCHIAALSLQVTVRPLVPGSNCILYSASIVLLSDSRFLIASGTAFGDIIVWSCLVKRTESGRTAECQTHYVFSAHQGSVFGVTIASSEDSAVFGGRQRVLTSCSDDRTIRVWDISDLTVQSPTLLELQRQTGFGSEGSIESAGPQCLATKMGHVSRIWQVAFTRTACKPHRDDDARNPTLTSFGEDATAITWSVRNAAAEHTEPFDLQQVSLRRAHAGKNIWSVAHSPGLDLVTGGADGSLAVMSSRGVSSDVPETEISSKLIDLVDCDDHFKSYAFASNNELVTTTERGKVLQILLEDGSHSLLTISEAAVALTNYSLVASIAEHTVVAGKYSVQHRCPTQNILKTIVETERKVSGLFVQYWPSSKDTRGRSLAILITTVGSITAQLVRLNPSLKPEATGQYEDQDRLVYDMSIPKGFVVTSFACSLLGDFICVLLGSRSGSIAIYHYPSEDVRAVIPEPRILIGVHMAEAVTSISFNDSLSVHDTKTYATIVYSTGRDGTYAAHELTVGDDENLQLQTIHQLLLPFGPNIEGLSIEQNGTVWVWGFRGKHFVVYDVTSQREIMSVECGGAHRNWALQRKKHGGIFVWTKASRLFYAQQRHFPFQLINSGGHGREIKCVSVSPEPCGIIATGAEDTNIKLSVYRDGHLRCLHTLQKHNTGIQHLQWSADGQYLFSSGGFEEFFVWRIRANSKITGIEIGVICDSVHPNSGSSDLRIMSFSAQHYAGGYEITMVYSNSDVKRWRYNNGTWTEIAHGAYLTTCLTQCVQLAQGDGGLITASTDGHVVVWNTISSTGGDAEPSLAWTSRWRVHQNAVLVLENYQLDDGTTLLITGGDDNAIGITRIPATKSTTTVISASAHTTSADADPAVLLLTRAHAAAVTGLSIVGVRHDRVRFVSTGLDQRVKLWEIEIDVSQTGIACVTNVRRVMNKEIESDFTAVADISGLAILQLSHRSSPDYIDREASAEDGRDSRTAVVICGVGMEIWTLDYW